MPMGMASAMMWMIVLAPTMLRGYAKVTAQSMKMPMASATIWTSVPICRLAILGMRTTRCASTRSRVVPAGLSRTQSVSAEGFAYQMSMGMAYVMMWTSAPTPQPATTALEMWRDPACLCVLMCTLCIPVETLAGQTTYRLYVVLQNSTDFLSAINGDGSTPLAISTTTSFHQDAFGAPASSGISSALLQLQFFPDLIYDSYVTIGHSPEDGPAEHDIIMVNSPSQNWVAAFEAGGDIVMDDAVGGLWAIYNEGNAQGLPDASGKVLIAQLTTDGAISVILGAQVFPDFGCCSNGSANGDGEWRPYPVELSTICSINEECLFEDECGVCGGFGTDVDADGICDFVEPVEFDGHTYAVVEIGDQCWFSENLRTTFYGNGDAIPAGLTDGQWTTTNSGATAVYGEGSSTCYNDSPDIDACDEAQSLEEYGRLYNWYAVDDARGLCPSGWHVPTDEEWTDLENYITSQGFSGTEGTALKSQTWVEPIRKWHR